MHGSRDRGKIVEFGHHPLGITAVIQVDRILPRKSVASSEKRPEVTTIPASACSLVTTPSISRMTETPTSFRFHCLQWQLLGGAALVFAVDSIFSKKEDREPDTAESVRTDGVAES